jgi:hypothetical protein
MSIACPNKNSKEWKMLVKQVGEDLAHRAFAFNNFQMPDVKPVTEIKKAIGFQPTLENTAGFASKLRKYNERNNTSHSFETKPVWGNTVAITMKYNYLPVNKTQQQLRDLRRQEPMAVENLTNTYPNASIQEQIRQLDLFDSMDIIPSASSQVESSEKVRIRKLNTEYIRQRDLLKKTTDKDAMKVITGNIIELKQEIDESEGRIIRSQGIEGFEEVLQFADVQLAEVQDLLTKPAVSADDLNYAQRIINLWVKAGDFSTPADEHIILDEFEFDTPDIREEFRGRAAKAEDLQRKITTIARDHVTAFVREHSGRPLTTEEIYKHLVDTNRLSVETLNLSRLGDPMLSALFSAVERANIVAQQEANEIWKDLDKLTAAFLKKTNNSYDILKQRTADGLETGRLVDRFSDEFYKKRNDLIEQTFNRRDKKSGKAKQDKALVKNFYDWTRANTIMFDPRMLFVDTLPSDSAIPDKFLYNRVTFSEADKIAHIADLKKQLGEKGYAIYLERAKTKVEKFQQERDVVYDKIQVNPYWSQDEKDAQFTEWLRENSPYWMMDMQDSPAMRLKPNNTYYAAKGLRAYVIQAPRRFVDGKETGWYDKNFDKIEADEDLLAYHTFIRDTLKSLNYILPPQKKRIMGVGVLPTLEKTLLDLFSEKGMMVGITPLWDKFKQLQTTTDFSTNISSDIDPLTGDIERSVQLQYIQDTDARVDELVRVKIIAHKQQTGKPATAEDRKRFRDEARDTLSKDKSWDLSKVLKAYSLNILAYKHKTNIEPQIKLIEQAFKERKEIQTNRAGQMQTKTRKGKSEVVTQEGLKNYKEGLEFFLKTVYGTGTRKVEGISKTKLYTKAEELRKKQLEELLANETDEDEKTFLQAQIDALGGYRTMSGVIDTALKFNTLKGLGWNLTSSFSNIGFGTIANLIEAADGRLMNSTNLRKAYMLTMNSIGRNMSADLLFNDPNGVATKIRSLMDDWDILQTSANELHDNSQKSSLGKLKRFGPYTLQQRSEYLNQAPIMIAVMMDMKAKDPSGNEVNLWDAMGQNAKLKDGYTTDVDIPKVIQKIKRISEMTHGDYNNQLKIKSTAAGRAISQFRTWMFEGFASRFEGEKVDDMLGYGMEEPYIRKGRYRSYTLGQLTTAGAGIGTMMLPGIGTVIGAGIGVLAGKLGGLETQYSAVEDTLFSLKQLARKLMFMKTNYGNKFTKVDAANMRKNMMELHLMLGLMGIALLLKAAIEDDDDDEQMITNFLLNQTIRLRTDIGFYTNPLEFEKLTKTAVPMASLVQDSYELVSDIKKLFDEDSENDVFASGPFKGHAKWAVHAGELIPGPAQAIKTYRTGSTIFDK